MTHADQSKTSSRPDVRSAITWAGLQADWFARLGETATTPSERDYYTTSAAHLRVLVQALTEDD